MTKNEIVTCRAHSRAIRAVALAVGVLLISNGAALALMGLALMKFAYDATSATAIIVFTVVVLLTSVPVWRIPLADRRTLAIAVTRCPKCKIIPKT